MNSHIFSFVECGNTVRKYVDGHNINPIAVVSENFNYAKMWQPQVIALVQMLQY